MKNITTYSFKKDISVSLPHRPQRSNKGTFGRTLIIAGSYGMCGAAILSARAAYRSGTGIVEIFTSEENRIILQSTIPEAVLCIYDKEYFSKELLLDALKRADSVAIGMGLGQSDLSHNIVEKSLNYICDTNIPCVIDADALNIISKDKNILNILKLSKNKNITITPHPGEMSRLTNSSIQEILGDIIGTAVKFSNEYNVICVLKDHRTVVYTPNNNLVYLNNTGNSGMATGGSGDVLAGIIAGLSSQGICAEDAAKLGVYLHGLAGDIAKKNSGEYSMMASDIIDALPKAFIECESNIVNLKI